MGVISSRDAAEKLKHAFNLFHVLQHSIRGEAKFSGDVTTPHFPDTYYDLEEKISPSYEGAIHLVGAGGLGKSYCHIIKQRGGIAIDIGAIFDAWVNVKSRLIHPSHSLNCFYQHPVISAAKACDRFNALCNHFDIDTERLDIARYAEVEKTAW